MSTRRLPRLLLAAGIALAVLLAIVAAFPQLALEAEFARLRWQAGASVHATHAAGHDIVHVEAGSGPVRVLLHGFTGSKENWLALMPMLSARHRVLAPDLPGWGGSSRQADADYGYAAQADRIAEWIAAVSDAPVHLVGHSMGGGIAALVAARHPQRVSKLVLLDAGGARFRDNAFGLAVLRGENPFAVQDRASLDRYLATVFVQPPWVPWPADRALVARRIADRGFEDDVLDRIGRGPDAFLPATEAPRIVAPTLLLWCRDDRVVDASGADLYHAAIRGSVMRLMDGCNHMPMMERPAETAALLEEFLQ